MLDQPAHAMDNAWRALADDLQRTDRLVLAVSGGPDSLALAVGFSKLKNEGLLTAPITAVTVDHGLRAESDAEALFVADACTQLGLAHKTVRLDAKPAKGNLQAWARDGRYRALAEIAGPDGLILTAHTADDQAETFLMRAARGTGPEGLAAIRPRSTIAGVAVCRPFLSWRREALHAVLFDSGLDPVHDPSNTDGTFARVRFRGWLADAPNPDGAREVVDGLAESARLAALDADALDSMAWQLVRQLDGDCHGYFDGTGDLCTGPVAVLARMIRMILGAVSRAAEERRPLDLARLVALAQDVRDEPSGKAVIGGACLEWVTDGAQTNLVAYAELGRDGLPNVTVDPGSQAVWDNRFVVRNGSLEAVTVRGYQRTDGDIKGEHRARVLATLPVAEDMRGKLVGAAPSLKPLAGQGAQVSIAALTRNRTGHS